MLWVRDDGDVSSSDTVIYKGGASAGTSGYDMELGTGNWTFHVTDGTNNGSLVATADDTPYIGKWTHLVAVVDRTNNVFTSFINGVQTNTFSIAGYGNIDSSSKKFTIGSISDGTFPFKGGIDDIRVYNYARTPGQIAWDYNHGAPVAWWKLDECSGTIVHDSMGNIANGTVVPGAGSNTAAGTCGSGTTSEMWNDGTTGKRNASLGFDSTDDAVTFSADAKLNLTTGGTISAWIYPNSTGENSFGRIVDKSSDTSATGGYDLGMSGTGFYGEMTNGANTNCSSQTNSVPFGQWSHVTWTFDGANWKLFVNGLLNFTCATTRLPSATSLGVTIGNRQGATDRTFDGLIDDLQIYTYPLTPIQVKAVYNQNSAVRFGPATGTP